MKFPMYDQSSYNGEKYVLWHDVSNPDWYSIRKRGNSTHFVDVSTSQCIIQLGNCLDVGTGVIDINDFYPDWMAFCGKSYDTYIPFQSEEDFTMAILKYPELFENCEKVDFDDVW